MYTGYGVYGPRTRISGQKLFRKLKSIEEGKFPSPSSALPYGTPENVVEQSHGLVAPPPPTPRIVSLKDRQSHQEALICSFIAEHSLPLSLAPHIVSLAQELSRDYKALQELRLERTSATCKLKEGVSAVFHKRLVSAMKNTPFSVNIDHGFGGECDLN